MDHLAVASSPMELPLVQEQGVVRRRFERQVAAQRSWSDTLDVAASEMSGCTQADDAAIADWDVDVRHDLVVPNSGAEIGATLAASRGQPAAITPTYKSGAVAAASNNAPSANSELELEEDDDGLLVYLKDEKGHPAGEWPLRVFVAEAMAEYRNGRTIQAGIRRVIELCGGGRGLARVILYRIAEFETGEEARVWLVHDIDRVLAELEPPVKELPAFRGQALAPTTRRRGDVGSSESDQTVIDPSVYRRTLHHQRRLQLPGERRVSGLPTLHDDARLSVSPHFGNGVDQAAISPSVLNWVLDQQRRLQDAVASPAHRAALDHARSSCVSAPSGDVDNDDEEDQTLVASRAWHAERARPRHELTLAAAASVCTPSDSESDAETADPKYLARRAVLERELEDDLAAVERKYSTSAAAPDPEDRDAVNTSIDFHDQRGDVTASCTLQDLLDHAMADFRATYQHSTVAEWLRRVVVLCRRCADLSREVLYRLANHAAVAEVRTEFLEEIEGVLAVLETPTQLTETNTSYGDHAPQAPRTPPARRRLDEADRTPRAWPPAIDTKRSPTGRRGAQDAERTPPTPHRIHNAVSPHTPTRRREREPAQTYTPAHREGGEAALSPSPRRSSLNVLCVSDAWGIQVKNSRPPWR